MLYVYSPREPAQEFKQYVLAGGGSGRMPKPFHFDLSADAPERAAEFYRQVFEWKVEKWAGPSDYWMMSTGDADNPGITGGVAGRIAPGDTTVMMIGVPDVDQFAARVMKAGGTIREPRRAIPGVGYLVTCRDTDGNTFGIMQLDQNAQ
jgi:uncharacterized protein